jgi:hypothetical protein
MRKIGKKRGKEQSAAGQLQFPFSRAGTCGAVGQRDSVGIRIHPGRTGGGAHGVVRRAPYPSGAPGSNARRGRAEFFGLGRPSRRGPTSAGARQVAS